MKTKITTHYEPSEFGDFKTGSSITHEYCGGCEKLQEENKELLTGFKGACPTCEPVGELNKKLQAKEEIYEEMRAIYADKNNWYGQDLASSEGRHARECGEKIKAIDNNHKTATKQP